MAGCVCFPTFIVASPFFHSFIFYQQVRITVPKDGFISALLHEVSIQTGVDKDKVGMI